MDGQKTTRQLNVPLLVGTLIAAAVLSPAAYCWHSYQVNRTAVALVERAKSLEEEESWEAAATYYYRYLKLRPDDPDARIGFAEAYDKAGKDPGRAIALYHAALGAAPADRQRALRVRLVELLLQRNRFPAAEAEVWKLLEADDKDPQGRRLLAFALLPQARSGVAVAVPVGKAFWQALKLNPGDVGLSGALARIYRDQERLLGNEQPVLADAAREELAGWLRDKKRPLSEAERKHLADWLVERIRSSEKSALTKAARERLPNALVEQILSDGQPTLTYTEREQLADWAVGERQERVDWALGQRELLADWIVDQMVAKNPKNPEAFLARYRYRLQYRLPRAGEDLDAALKYGPDNLAVLLSKAEHLVREATHVQRQEHSLSEARRKELVHRLAKWFVQKWGLSEAQRKELAKWVRDAKRGTSEAELKELAERLGNKEQGLSEAERKQLANWLVDKKQAFSGPERKKLADWLADKKWARPEPDRHELVEWFADWLCDKNWVLAEAPKWNVALNYYRARNHYQHLIKKIEPSNERAYLGLGEVHLGQGRVHQIQGARYKAEGESEKAQDELQNAEREVKLAIDAWRRGLEEGNKDSIRLNMRLAKLLVTLGRLKEAGEALNALDRAAARLPRRLPQDASRWLGHATRQSLKRSIDLQRARWLIGKRDLAKAIPLLKGVTAGGERTGAGSGEIVQAWGLLGWAYGQLAQWDQAARAYERVSVLQPQAPGPRLRAAASWEAANQPEKAIRHYKRVLAIDGAAADEDRRRVLTGAQRAETRLALARTHFQHQLKLPQKDRNWEPFARAFDKARSPKEGESLANVWRLRVLEADYILARGEERGERGEAIKHARELLDFAEKESPNSASFLGTLVLIYERLGYPDDADRALERFRRIAGEPPRACLLQSRLHSLRKQYGRAREALRAGLNADAVPRRLRRVLEHELAQISVREGRFDEALQELSKLHDDDSPSLGLLRELAELALDVGNLKEAERWEEKLRDLEGPDGPYSSYYEARRLLAQAKGPEDRKFRRATELLTEIQSQRPAWPAVHLLNGTVLERQGEFQQAAKAYREAIRLGDQRVVVYERLVRLLYQLRRFDEADEYLSKLEDQVPSSQSLSSLGISVAAIRGDRDRALKLAERSAEARPKDPMAQVRLGQMLWANEKKEEAEKAFLKAVRLAPTDERTPLGILFGFYVRTEQPERARETLQEFAENEKLTEIQQALVLALGYELLGDRKQAEANYRKAARFDPDNAGVQIRLANFLLGSGDPDGIREAKKRLRGVMELAPQSPEAAKARQMLAILAARGGEEEWQQVQKLLERPGTGQDASELDKRLQAALLARRGGEENIKKARGLLEHLVADPTKAAASDLLLLAGLDEADGDLQAARRQYLSLVNRVDSQPLHLGLYVEWLLRHGFRNEAAGWLARLEEVAPDDPITVTQRTRWLYSRGRASEIEPLVESHANKLLKKWENNEQQEMQLALRIGRLYSATGQYEAAERWYRRLVTRTDPRAAHLALYVGVLLQHDPRNEAAEWLKKLEEAAPDSFVPLGLRVRWLHGQDRTPEIEPLVERLADKLLKEVKKNGEESQICLGIGNLYTVVEQHQAAERWYRRLVKLDSENYGPLAISLGRQGRIRDAVDVCTKAAKSDGSPRPAVTLASVLLAGKPTAEEFRLAEPLLAKTVESHKDQVDLLYSVANLRIVREQADEAIELYERVVKLERNHVLGLNNLATLLGEQPARRKEALEYIDRAIEIAGPQAALLDTKGMILVHQQKADEAVQCLETAASVPRADPRFHFHLALAYHLDGKVEQARGALKKARDGDLASQILTKTDRKLLAELEQKLGQ